MRLPCPHCGGSKSHAERSPTDFKPIVPLEIQGTFIEPPPPINSSNLGSDPGTGQLSKSSGFTLSSTLPMKESSPSAPQAAFYPPGASMQTMELPVSPSPSVPKQPQSRLGFASPAARGANVTPAIEVRLEKIENSINSLENDVKSILQAQNTTEMILKRMWNKQ